MRTSSIPLIGFFRNSGAFPLNADFTASERLPAPGVRKVAMPRDWMAVVASFSFPAFITVWGNAGGAEDAVRDEPEGLERPRRVGLLPNRIRTLDQGWLHGAHGRPERAHVNRQLPDDFVGPARFDAAAPVGPHEVRGLGVAREPGGPIDSR